MPIYIDAEMSFQTTKRAKVESAMSNPMLKLTALMVAVALAFPAAVLASSRDYDKPGRGNGKPSANEYYQEQDRIEYERERLEYERERIEDELDRAEDELDRAEEEADRARDAKEEAFERKMNSSSGRPEWAGKDKDKNKDKDRDDAESRDDVVIGYPEDSIDETPSVDVTETVEPERKTGIENALSRIQANIARAEGKVAAGQKEQVPPGLLRVLEKFLAWLGLTAVDPVPADPVTPEDPNGSDETTPSVEPTPSVDATVVPEPSVEPTPGVTSDQTVQPCPVCLPAS